MLQKLSQSIMEHKQILVVLKAIGWVVVLAAIILSTMLMKEQEISFVYNNF